MNFADRLIKKIQETTPICVGLDPRWEQIPESIREKAETVGQAYFEFNQGIIDAVCDLVPVVKPQLAFYEACGIDGLTAYAETVQYAKKKGLIVLADGKRNDIGSTAEAYADAYLDEGDFGADALTVNAYLGLDGINPFLNKCKEKGKGIFILVKTSNPSSGDLQDRNVDDANMTVYDLMGQLVDSWGADLMGKGGYSAVGAVVGATYPEQLTELRQKLPHTFFLVPGYGAQGGGAKDVKGAFDKKGRGAIINSSRGIIFAYQKSKKFGEKEYKEAARDAVEKMKKDLESVL